MRDHAPTKRLDGSVCVTPSADVAVRWFEMITGQEPTAEEHPPPRWRVRGAYLLRRVRA